MLNRLTVSALLQAVILITSFCVVVGISIDAWDAWGRLRQTSRISTVADASANMFKAMHNLRTDRATTNRLLNSDQPVDGEIDKYLRNIRDAQMPALSTALGLLPLAIGSGAAGQEIEGPLAVVILGGLITSTALNLLVLPTLALRFGHFERRSHQS